MSHVIMAEKQARETQPFASCGGILDARSDFLATKSIRILSTIIYLYCSQVIGGRRSMCFLFQASLNLSGIY